MDVGLESHDDGVAGPVKTAFSTTRTAATGGPRRQRQVMVELEMGVMGGTARQDAELG